MAEPTTSVVGDRYSAAASSGAFDFVSTTERAANFSRQERIGDVLSYGLPSVLAGMADRFGTSLGLVDDDTVANYLQNNTAEFGDYYANNKEGSQVAGDIVGMLIPGLPAMKAVQGGGVVYKGLSRFTGKESKLLKSVFTSGKSYDELLRGVRKQDRLLAQKGTRTVGEELMRKQLARKAITTKITDTIKENLAFELALVPTMNTSDVLFPDDYDFIDQLALSMALPTILAGAEGLYMRRLIRQSAMDVGKVANQALNKEEVPFNDIIFRPGNRDGGVTLYSVAADAAQKEFDEGARAADATGIGDDLKLQNFNREILQLRKEVQEQIGKMGSDKPIKQLTNQIQMSQKQINAAMEAQKQDPTSLLGTLSIENAGDDTVETVTSWFKRRDELVKKNRAQIEELEVKKVMDDEFDVTELNSLRTETDQIEGLELFVLEADGKISIARGRKDIFQDGPRTVKKNRATVNEPAYYSTKLGNETFAVSEDGIAVIPPVGETENIIGGVNVTQIIPPAQVAQVSEQQSKILFDLGKVYHVNGQLGQPIVDSLSPALREEIRKWTGNSGASQLRKWIADGNPFAKELENAMEPVRARLREVADADGTITLYRGENKTETDWINKFRAGDPAANPAAINDVVSMTSNVQVAGGFGSGGNVISKRVHVDDVVMIVGGMGDEFEFIVKGNRNRVFGDVVSKRGFRALDLKKRTALYDAFQAAAENYKPKGPGSFILTENDHHTRIDYALELLRRYGDDPAVGQSIKLPKGVNSIQDLEFLSLSKKFEEYKLIADMIDASNDPRRLFNLADDQKPNYNDIIKMLNLPGTPDGTPHPLLHVFEEIASMQGDASFATAVKNMDDFQRMMQEYSTFPDITVYRDPTLEMRGKMMDIPRDNAPSMLVKRPLGSNDYQRDAILSVNAANNAFVKNLFANADKDGGDFVKTIYDHIDQLAASKVAKDVDTLTVGQERASDLLIQPQFAAGENAAMQAIHLVTNVIDREALELRAAILEPHLNNFARVRSKKENIDQFNLFAHARRQGWDLEGAAEEQGGKFLFPLRKTKANRERWESIFGDKMPENEKVYLPGQTLDSGNKGQKIYQPLAVNTEVYPMLESMTQIGKQIYDNTNVLRRATGRSPLNFKEWWIPPKNFHKEQSVFLVTPDGRMHSVQHGRTLADAKAKAQREIDNADGNLFLVDRQDMSKYFGLQDEMFERMLDFSDPINQTGRAKGTSVGDVVEFGESILDDINETFVRQFESLTRRTRALYFEPQINYARHIYNASGSERRLRGQTPWQHYIGAIYGNPTINPNDAVGKTYFTAESLYDDALNFVYDKKRAIMGAGERPTQATRGQKKDFQRLAEAMGDEYVPFQNAVDYAQRTYNVSTPTNMKQHMGALNRLTSFLTLQMGEVGHAILNMTSLAANMPAVVKSMNRMPNENIDQWKARIAAFATTMDESEVAMFSPHRASTYGMHLLFSAEGKPIRDEAARLGYFNQDVAEIVKTLIEPGQNYHQRLASKAASIAGYVSNKSEEVSRAASFMVGYGIAKRGLGIEGQKDAFSFAHNFANQVIGDYRPNNRPRIFQGAVGMPLGLFMTFTQNYFQRLFSYVENKQLGTLITQYAAQGAVFGGQTVPGFQQFNDLFVENYDGSVNLVDGLQNKYGTVVSDAILYGALGNLPKLFGSDDGFAIHTRGDANIQRIPGVWSIGNTPGVQMLKNGYDMLDKTLGMLQSNGGYNNQQMLEIASNYSQNRMLKNAFTLMAGYAVDRRGQVINDDIYSDVSLAARAMGLRPLLEAKKLEAHSRIRAGQLSQAAKMGDLRHAFRAGIRDGDMDEEEFTGLIEKYMKYGGNPNGIPRFLAEQHKKALVDKSTLELMKAISDPSRMADVKRLLNAQVLPQNDPHFD